MLGLTKIEITKLVNRYITVSGGYLGDFNYRSHADFYPEYCNLDIDPTDMGTTTRERFLAIIGAATCQEQAKIVRGILAKYPPATTDYPTRTQELHEEFSSIAERLEGSSPVDRPKLQITSDVVQRAIADAETLISNQGATSGVDRLHTILHGYMKAVCDRLSIIYMPDAKINTLFKLIREKHEAFIDLGHRSQDITTVMNSMASIMDAMNPIRNNASMAHPNKTLLDTPEAMLVINATKTILHYLNAKLLQSQRN